MMKNNEHRYRKEIEKHINKTLERKQELIDRMREECVTDDRFSLKSTLLLHVLDDRLILLNNIKESVENSVG